MATPALEPDSKLVVISDSRALRCDRGLTTRDDAFVVLVAVVVDADATVLATAD